MNKGKRKRCHTQLRFRSVLVRQGEENTTAVTDARVLVAAVTFYFILGTKI